MKRNYKLPDMIKKLKVERNLTYEDIAEEVGTREPIVCAWANHRQVPKLEFVIELAKFFEVSVDYLIFGEEYNAG